MDVPRRWRERGPLLIFLGFEQKSHREGVVIGRSTAQWEEINAHWSDCADGGCDCPNSGRSGPQQISKDEWFGGGKLEGSRGM
jgi:hypothetical protein